jgi:uncharacterized membrane-anchored protein
MKSCLLLVALILAVAVHAADPAADQTARVAQIEKLAKGLHYREGETTLGDGLAKISLPASFRYLDARDTATVLTDIWGNPKSTGTLGALIPAGFDPLGASESNSWLGVITFDEDGYVKDDDAAKIDYTKLLADMKEGVREESAAREKQGYHAIELIGWAQPPRYDERAHKLYWAKEIKFGQATEHTLNYNIRMLGRRGVLVLNVVATMPQLPEVEAAIPTLLKMVDFQEGNRYADFKPSTDKVATYGLAALVAGGIAAKAGFFKLLWVGILAFKKLIIIAVVALGAYVKKFWAWVRGRHAASNPMVTDGAPPPPVPPGNV